MRPADTLFIVASCIRDVADEVSDILALTLDSISGIEEATVMMPAGIPVSGDLIRLVVEIDFGTACALSQILVNRELRENLLAALAHPKVDAIVYQPMSRREMFSSHLESSRAPVLYLVEYPGVAEDLEAWLEYFDRIHAPILARLPNVRRVTTFRPTENVAGLAPWQLDGAMQRNTIMFDDVAAFDAALASPVLAEIRADSARFSAYSPGPTRTLMQARLVRGRGLR